MSKKNSATTFWTVVGAGLGALVGGGVGGLSFSKEISIGAAAAGGLLGGLAGNKLGARRK